LAGKIAAEVREHVKHIVREGMPILDICETVEGLIRQKGGKPAFPCNVSVNEIAAHYTSPIGDKQTIPTGCLVKIDIGTHVDGYIGDTAFTRCFNPEYDDLVTAAEEALQVGIKSLRAGESISHFGSIVQRAIESHGLKPVANLTGHQVARYILHAGKALPNVSHFLAGKVSAGETYAIEPFVTQKNAAGRVRNIREAYIFRYVKQKSLKNADSKKLLSYIVKNFRNLPFTERWLRNVVSSENYGAAFRELLSSKALMAYPVFVEASGKLVAQAEHTVLIMKEGCEVLT